MAVSGSFDPYHKWLGIAPKDQPPDYYRLLGIDRFEPDPDVISDAADQRMAHVRTRQAGKHASAAEGILSHLARARVCLLDCRSKAQYDDLLNTATELGLNITVAPGAVDVAGDLTLDEDLDGEASREDWGGQIQAYRDFLEAHRQRTGADESPLAEPSITDCTDDDVTDRSLGQIATGESDDGREITLPQDCVIQSDGGGEDLPVPKTMLLAESRDVRGATREKREIATNQPSYTYMRLSMLWLLSLGVLAVVAFWKPGGQLPEAEEVLDRGDVQNAPTEDEVVPPPVTSSAANSEPIAVFLPTRLEEKAATEAAFLEPSEETEAITGALDRSAEDCLERGLAACKSGQLDQALAEFGEAASLDPRYHRAFYNRGCVWVLKGDYNRAIADYDQAITLAPGYGLAYLHRGLAWERTGERDKALRDYEMARGLGWAIPNYAATAGRYKTPIEPAMEYYRKRAAASRSRKDRPEAGADSSGPGLTGIPARP